MAATQSQQQQPLGPNVQDGSTPSEFPPEVIPTSSTPDAPSSRTSTSTSIPLGENTTNSNCLDIPSTKDTIIKANDKSTTGNPLLRRHPTDLTDSIPEECDGETASESSPNEPLTPASGRQSREFHQLQHPDLYHQHDSISQALAASGISGFSAHQDAPVTNSLHHQDEPKSPVSLATTITPTTLTSPAQPSESNNNTNKDSSIIAENNITGKNTQGPQSPIEKVATNESESLNKTPTVDLQSEKPEGAKLTGAKSTPSRPKPRQQSASSFTLRAKSFFKRSTVSSPTSPPAETTDTGSTASMAFKEPNYNPPPSESNSDSKSDPKSPPTNKLFTPSKNSHNRRFSFHRSATSPRADTPPSPSSPTDKDDAGRVSSSAPTGNAKSNRVSMPPTSSIAFANSKTKARAHTGLSIRDKVTSFARPSHNPEPRLHRTKSLGRGKQERRDKEKSGIHDLTRQPWAVAPDVGTGMKARRLSVSLPDDFFVDVADLTKEFEYQHKFLGRHGKHLGKGATSKVTLMVRKGTVGEMYAVKEFRGKNSHETSEEYENKIKSEYSIAKSLHHPNIVETIRLCTDHGRWNHVMEYCSEGDLFGLVSKKYLKDESHEKDRLCLFKQLCQGVNYLHSNGIAHRDIKLENLLITKDSKLKITDFGVSEVFSGIHPGLREAGGQCGKNMGEVRLCKPGVCGSLPYIAPEVVCKRDEYDPRPLDVWSSAVVMIYLVFNACLWEKAEAGPNTPTYLQLVGNWEKLNKRKAENPVDLKDAYPKVDAFEAFVKPVALRRLLLNMLNPDPSKRPTMSEVVNNRWFKSIECCQLESYEDPVKCIDASKKNCLVGGSGKVFCHNHLPLQASGHGLPPMPGKPGY